MTTAEWCAAIDAFREGGMGRASLIGGEPLLHEDVGVIIRHLKARGVHTAMNTNGWLVPDRIEFWQSQINRLHDRIRYERASDGSWSRQRLMP